MNVEESTEKHSKDASQLKKLKQQDLRKTIRLTREQHAAISIYAKAQGIEISEAIRKLIAAGIESRSSIAFDSKSEFSEELRHAHIEMLEELNNMREEMIMILKIMDERLHIIQDQYLEVMGLE